MVVLLLVALAIAGDANRGTAPTNCGCTIQHQWCAKDFADHAGKGADQFDLKYDGPKLGFRVHGFGATWLAWPNGDEIVVQVGGRYLGFRTIPVAWNEVWIVYRGMSLSLPNTAVVEYDCR